MPTTSEILAGLGEIANDWQSLAILWHVYFAALVSALLAIRPSMRLVGLAIGLPPFSVSALAWAYGNPFNGTFFLLIGGALLLLAFRLPNDDIRFAPSWATVTGALIMVFGWVYPHFLETASFYPYLYSAPTGLIPCPTLSMLIGLSIIVGSFGVRTWSIVLGLSGAFYGVFGAVYLGVSLDWVLLFGASAVLVTVSGNTKKVGTAAG